MKLNAIKQCCMETKHCGVITAADGAQWLSDGWNFWRVCGFRIDADSVPELFGLTLKQLYMLEINDIHRTDPVFCNNYTTDAEPLMELRDVWAYDSMLKALEVGNGDGVLFIPEDAMKPARIAESTAFVPVYTNSGAMLVAVCNGLFIDALLLPVNRDTAESITRALGRIAALRAWSGEAAGDEQGAVHMS